MEKNSSEYQASLDLCQDTGKGVVRVLEIMKRLRDKEHGCPWDLEQDYRSLSSSIIEEAYEVVDAIESNNKSDLKEELGDLLFGIVFLSQLASEDNEFNFYTVVEGVSDKMVRRHPHIFADNKDIKTVEDQIVNWEKMKQLENQGQKQGTKGKMETFKSSKLPALLLGQKWYKTTHMEIDEGKELKDNIIEVKNIMGKLSPATSKASSYINLLLMGEILYTMVKISRCISVDPELALKNAVKARAASSGLS